MKRHYKIWSKAEVAKLRSIYAVTPMAELSRILGHPKESIVTKASKLRLSRRFWTRERLKTLRKLYPDSFLRELQSIFGITGSSISIKAKKLGLEKSDAYGIRKRAVEADARRRGQIIRGCHKWSEEERSILRTRYANQPGADIAKDLGLSVFQIYQEAHRLGLKKDPEFIRETGRVTAQHPAVIAHRFKKGQISHNKGKKGIIYPGSEKGWFKKGQLPHTTLYDGAITIRADKDTGRRYKWIRISKAKWMMLHVKVWEDHHGKLPPGHIVVFTNGDSMNCGIENLRAITNAQHMEETRSTDQFIVTTMTKIPGKRGVYDRELAAELLNHPDLIEAKRKQLELNRTIKGLNNG